VVWSSGVIVIGVRAPLAQDAEDPVADCASQLVDVVVGDRRCAMGGVAVTDRRAAGE
jgi:hypothetical protein